MLKVGGKKGRIGGKKEGIVPDDGEVEEVKL